MKVLAILPRCTGLSETTWLPNDSIGTKPLYPDLIISLKASCNMLHVQIQKSLSVGVGVQSLDNTILFALVIIYYRGERGSILICQ